MRIVFILFCFLSGVALNVTVFAQQNSSSEFSIFIPRRITVMEDATGEVWLMTMDWGVSWLAKAW